MLAELEGARTDVESRLIAEREQAEETARATAEEYDATRTRLESERDALQRDLAAAQSAAAGIRADLERHVREVSERATETDTALRERISALEADLAQARNETERSGGLAARLAQVQQELSDVRAAVDAERHGWSADRQSLLSTRDAHEHDARATRQALAALEAEHHLLRAAHDRLEQELAALTSAHAALGADRELADRRLAEVATERERIEQAAEATRAAFDELSEARQSAARERETLEQALGVLRSDYASMVHALGGERAGRERDRARLAALENELAEAQDRQGGLERELEETAREAEALLRRREIEHTQRLQMLERDLTEGAARLVRVADEAERARATLHVEFSRAAESHHRLIASDVFGYAVTTLAGELVRCNDAFARLFGFTDAPDAMTRTAGRTIAGLADRPALAARFATDGHADRVEACLERADGQPVRILQSATLLADGSDGETLVEHVLLGMPAAPSATERRAQRLAAVGTLASEMVPDLEALVTTLHERSGDSGANRSEIADLAGHVAALVRQLGAFSRRQARATSQVDLSQAVVRAEPTLLRLVGDYIAFSTDLQETAPVAAHVDDLEHVLTSLVTLGRDLLPAGGSIVVETRPGGSDARAGAGDETDGPRVIVSASGYGVQIPERAQALEQLIERAGGHLRIHGETGWIVRLDVAFPRCGKASRTPWGWME